MRFFPIFDFQIFVLLTFLGLVAVALLLIAFRSPRFSKDQPERAEGGEDDPGGIKTGKNPIPPILIFVYMAFIIWAIVYVMFIGIKGDAF